MRLFSRKHVVGRVFIDPQKEMNAITLAQLQAAGNVDWYDHFFVLAYQPIDD